MMIMNSKRIILNTFVVAILLIICSGVALAERFTVASKVANIRSGPGTKHEILWKIEKYHPFFVLKKSGQWYYFRDFEGDRGWIHKTLVCKVQSVITNKAKCNIRSGPGTGFKVLFMAEKGIPFKVIKRKNKWIYVQHADGDKGWIHKSLLW